LEKAATLRSAVAMDTAVRQVVNWISFYFPSASELARGSKLSDVFLGVAKASFVVSPSSADPKNIHFISHSAQRSCVRFARHAIQRIEKERI
jgi:hypothetical protein